MLRFWWLRKAEERWFLLSLWTKFNCSFTLKIVSPFFVSSSVSFLSCSSCLCWILIFIYSLDCSCYHESLLTCTSQVFLAKFRFSFRTVDDIRSVSFPVSAELIFWRLPKNCILQINHIFHNSTLSTSIFILDINALSPLLATSSGFNRITSHVLLTAASYTPPIRPKQFQKPQHHSHTHGLPPNSFFPSFQMPPFPTSTLIVKEGSPPNIDIGTGNMILKVISTICEVPLILSALFLAGIILYGCLNGELFRSIEDRKDIED